ncbi:fibronectin type III domain-containing protein [Cohnella rhizosphaerae]|uniref:Fibronectin type III domain-containing protein n=1 Tax=Cohnella rhizosphaerae TaxID=1457232 RepID=A0A9X4QVL3_9BACL|nr:fibronectin type III domain-containing protein [Cohnella rhizosphaerae]MDG0812714.1 fibronectin type III domain-containing protein [Cohnella rhizosphaerae]
MDRRFLFLIGSALVLALTVFFQTTREAEAASSAISSDIADEPPVITRLEPASDHAVIRSNSLQVLAEAEDDLAQPSFLVQIGRDLRYPDIVESDQGAGRFDRVYDVTRYDGKSLNIQYSISDGRLPDGEDNRRVNVKRTVHIESSPALAETDREPDAQILDADASRLLLLRNGALIVKERMNGTETELLEGVTTDRSDGFKLTPAGAVFLIDTGWYELKLFWWNGESLMSIPLESGAVWQARGNYIACSDAGTLHWIDTAAGTVRHIPYAYDLNFELEPGGTLLLEPSGNDGHNDDIVRYDPLTGSATTAFSYPGAPRGPVTDGSAILFTLNDGRLMKFADGTVTEVNAGTVGERRSPHKDYEINEGWIAFRKPDAGSEGQLYLQSPEGTATQATNFDSNADIHCLDGSGTLIFNRDGQLYRYDREINNSTRIAGAAGVVRWIDGQLRYLLGDTIFAVQQQPPEDTEAPAWPEGDVLTFSHATYSSAALRWQQAADEGGVSKYLLYQNDQLLATLSGTANSYEAQALSPKSTYLFSLVAVDAAGNESEKKTAAIVTVVYQPVPKPETLLYSFEGTILDFDQKRILWKQSGNNALWLYDRIDKSQVKIYEASGSSSMITKGGLSVEGVVYTLTADGSPTTYEWKNGAVVHEWEGEGQSHYQTRGLPDGKALYKVDGKTYLYDVQEGKIIYSLGGTGSVQYREHRFGGSGEQPYRIDAWYRMDGGSLYGV